MGKQSGKPGPDPKIDLENAAVPSPFRRGARSGSPVVEVKKEEAKKIKDWMKSHRA